MRFLVTDGDFPLMRRGGAGTSARVITALPCAVAHEFICITFRQALCWAWVKEFLAWNWVCIQANKMQTSAAVLTQVLFSNANPMSALCCFSLIACLFGLGASVSLTRKNSEIKAKAIQTFAAELAQHANILSLTRKWCLELWGADTHLLLWLETHHCCFSMKNMLRENYYLPWKTWPQPPL